MREEWVEWGWTPLTLCQRQGKGGGHLAGRTGRGTSSSCSRGGGRGGGGGRSTGDWAFRHYYYTEENTHTHRMDQWPIRQIGLTVRWNMRGEEDDVLHREREENLWDLWPSVSNNSHYAVLSISKRQIKWMKLLLATTVLQSSPQIIRGNSVHYFSFCSSETCKKTGTPTKQP